MISLRYITKKYITMEDFELLIPIFAILMPVFILGIIFAYQNNSDKNKYNAIIEVSKNIKDAEQIQELFEGLSERKKSSIDLRRTGLVTIFLGVGLAALDYFGLRTNIVLGVGLLVMFIGIGQMFAGYVYPNQPYEINKAVEGFEEK
jgi:dolichol kinase